MPNGIQLRAGRAMAGMTAEELADVTGLPVEAVSEAEASAAIDPAITERLRLALEARGIVFLAAGEDNPGAGPGVRLRQRPPDDGIRPQHLSSANDG